MCVAIVYVLVCKEVSVSIVVGLAASMPEMPSHLHVFDMVSR